MARGGDFVVNIFLYLCSFISQDDSIAVTIDTFE